MKKRVFLVFSVLTLVLILALLVGFSSGISDVATTVSASESGNGSGKLSGTYKSVNGFSVVEFIDSNTLTWNEPAASFFGTYEKINSGYKLEVFEDIGGRPPFTIIIFIAEMDGEDLLITKSSENDSYIKDMDRERFVKQ